MRNIRSIAVLSIAIGTLAACDDASGPASGDVRVYMTRGTVSAAETATQASVYAAVQAGTIPLSAVDSINVVLTSIEAINSTDSSRAVSIALQGAGSSSINLLKLPALGADSLQLARGTLTAGTYNNIRLRFSSASIRLNQTVTAGTSVYPAGTYDLTVPSGLSSGIKVQGATFTVSDDATTSINLTFDPATSVGTIVATGSNKLMMNPVLKVRANVDED